MKGRAQFPSRRLLAETPRMRLCPLAGCDGQKSPKSAGVTEHLTGIRCRGQQASLHHPSVIAALLICQALGVWCIIPGLLQEVVFVPGVKDGERWHTSAPGERQAAQ